MKTAVIILNHNLPDYTDMLYESLKPYEGGLYDTMVFDNGSKPEGKSRYTTYESETNGFFGGGFEAARQIVLADPQYDSLLFMNNDLTVHGMNFVKMLRLAMFSSHLRPVAYHVISPCFFNIEPKGQCHWKTMWNWGHQYPRPVPFIDMQAPLIHRKVLEAMGETDSDLMYGWGIDVYMAHICKSNRWPMAVVDSVSMLHHNSLTVKRGVAGLDIPTYCRLAEEGQHKFFTKMNLMNEFAQIRAEANQYKI
jgi:hypothetical protein